VAPQEPEDRNTNLIAAAEAAASWARARRATWTRAPLGIEEPRSEPSREPLPPIEFETAAAPPVAPAPRTASPPVALAPPRPAPLPSPALSAMPPTKIALESAHPERAFEASAFSPRTSPAFDSAPPPFVAQTPDEPTDTGPSTPSTVWLARAAVAAAVAGGAALAWPYLSKALTPAPVVVEAPTPADTVDVGPKLPPGKGIGALKVESSPSGAQVLLDGKARGVTPLTLKDLPTGKHEVMLRSDQGTVRRTVTIAANQTESLDEQIFSGWVTVYSPFEVTIAEGSRVMRPDDRNQFMLPPGIHELRVVNKSLAYDAVLQVDVKPGDGTTVRLTPPPSTLTVTAPETAEVTVDGTRAGDTPLNGFSVPLGTHDIVVKRANGSEKRYTITVGVKPYALNVEF